MAISCRSIVATMLLTLVISSIFSGVVSQGLQYQLADDQCTSLFGFGIAFRNITVVFTADPGVNYGGIGENFFLLQQLHDARNITLPLCYEATVGFLAGQPVALVTTGEGPSTAQVCVAEVLQCIHVIREVMYFGTAGFSPRLNGVFNPPNSCTPPKEPGTLIRAGDLCITNLAVNWDCQTGSWTATSAGFPNLCTLPSNPNQPFTDLSSESIYIAGYRGWDCFVRPPKWASEELLQGLLDAAEQVTSNFNTSSIPESAQLYTEYYWTNTSAGLFDGKINPAWIPDKMAAPTVLGPSECAEIDSVYWWTGVPWDAVARGMASIAINNNDIDNATTPSVAASAMEGIGFLSSIERAYNLTGIAVPFAIIRSASDFTFPPSIKAENGTWLQGPSIQVSIHGRDGEQSLPPATIYAVQTGCDVIFELMKQRCKKTGKTVDQCNQVAVANDTSNNNNGGAEGLALSPSAAGKNFGRRNELLAVLSTLIPALMTVF